MRTVTRYKRNFSTVGYRSRGMLRKKIERYCLTAKENIFSFLMKRNNLEHMGNASCSVSTEGNKDIETEHGLHYFTN